ncbi:MAG: Crp/Fnr family transcriptional regulator [Bacteroidaceae bacterium]|nr:Crp/Fnr family transcriptional regulator [Bacteroidaceae bacterium]
MYENLLCLPYFQGMSKDDITAILDKVTFDFVKYGDGEFICHKNENCDKFQILVQGKMNVMTEAPDNSYRLTEDIVAPFAIEPYSMFGYNTGYKRDYKAEGNCTVLALEKKFLFSELIKQNIFSINFLNLISHKAQKTEQMIWADTPESIAARIYKFILLRCEQQHGRKVLSIKMERLASILCETRLNVSKALNEMQNNGIIELHRKEIVIPSLNKLSEYVKE